MPKTLKPTYQKNCTGCELCVIEVQQQLKKVGLEGAILRIFRNEEKGGVAFSVVIDPQIDKLNLERIKNICPKKVFNIVDKEHEFKL
jgi:hypothetical protein